LALFLEFRDKVVTSVTGLKYSPVKLTNFFQVALSLPRRCLRLDLDRQKSLAGKKSLTSKSSPIRPEREKLIATDMSLYPIAVLTQQGFQANSIALDLFAI